MARPSRDEADSYYWGYIDQVAGSEVLTRLENQAGEIGQLLRSISSERSLHRYAPGKWSIRELWSHVTDTERAFTFRALWFARGFDQPLPGFDQDIAARGASADASPWEAHIEDFAAVRQATLTLFRMLPEEAWLRRGIASGKEFTVRALAYITAGHVEHHAAILRERYLA